MMKSSGYTLREYLEKAFTIIHLNGDRAAVEATARKYAELCSASGLHINPTLAAACVYASLRLNGKPIHIRRFARVVNIPVSQLHSRYITLLSVINGKPPILKPTEYLLTVAEELGLEADIVAEARRLLELTKLHHAPSAAAAAIIVAAKRLGKNIDEYRIERVSGASRPSIQWKKTLLEKVADGARAH